MGKYLLFENEGESYLLYFLPDKSLNNCIFNHHYFSIPIDKHWLFKTKGDIICAAFPIIKYVITPQLFIPSTYIRIVRCGNY